MSDAQSGTSTSKSVVIVILVAVVTALAVTVLQELLLGQAKAAVTGGLVGAITAVVALNTMKKKSS